MSGFRVDERSGSRPSGPHRTPRAGAADCINERLGRWTKHVDVCSGSWGTRRCVVYPAARRNVGIDERGP
jgi:hypothetical protein